jgi:peptidoglycan/LPS O-acetylase OafA/YrhL
MHERATRAWLAALVGGAALWLITTAVSGRREAWDSSLYWTVAYPLAIAWAGGLGYWAPEKPWRWGLAVMLAQALVLTIASADFGLLPLGAILFSVLALPAVAVARAMAKLRLRREAS